MKVGSTSNPSRLKIAVIGTGISGLSAAWLLNKKHDVTVYEQNGYVGGHSNTADVCIDGDTVPVDTGFIVYNPLNYPNLVALFEHLKVPTTNSNMSFAASLNDGKLEYSGTDLNGLLSQRRNILRPRFLRMIKDLLHFYRQAPSLVNDQSLRRVCLGDFLKSQNYSDAFIHDHLMPMGAAIWSTSVSQMLSFPTLSFLRFFQNHGLVQLAGRPEWRTVDGGSREYVKRLTESFKDQIRCGDPVVKVTRDGQTTTVATAGGRTHNTYDHVVFACHADQALELLANPTAEEQVTLSKIRYQPNTAVLHTDTKMMPRSRRAWASWNYIGSGENPAEQSLCVTYWMNLLQDLAIPKPIFVTLNPNRDIDPDKVLCSYDYEHPLFDSAAIHAQPRLWDLQGRQNSWFCGAYFGSGFHEDGIQSGLAVAERLGGLKRPWVLPSQSSRVGLSNEGYPLPITEAAIA